MIKKRVKIKEIQAASIRLLDELDNIKEFGHVGCFDSKERVDKCAEMALEKLEQAADWLADINQIAQDNYEL